MAIVVGYDYMNIALEELEPDGCKWPFWLNITISNKLYIGKLKANTAPKNTCNQNNN